MAKKINKLIIISSWRSKEHLQQLKKRVESNLQNVNSYFYLFYVDSPKKIESLPQIPEVYYLSKKDLNMLGKIKTPKLRGLLLQDNKGILLVAMNETNKVINKLLKQTQLTSIGAENKDLPLFDFSFRDVNANDEQFYKQINNYINKIQL